MGAEVYIQANDVWKFFQDNKKRLSREMVIVAENTDSDYAVYLSEEGDLPVLSVCRGNNDAEYEEYILNESDCAPSTKRLFIQYLLPVTVIDNSAEEPPKEQSRQYKEDLSYERRDELTLALCEFLSVVFEDALDDSTGILDLYGEPLITEILESFLEYLAQEQCFPIYYPMLITDMETGSEEFVEYPFNDDESYLE